MGKISRRSRQRFFFFLGSVRLKISNQYTTTDRFLLPLKAHPFIHHLHFQKKSNIHNIKKRNQWKWVTENKQKKKPQTEYFYLFSFQSVSFPYTFVSTSPLSCSPLHSSVIFPSSVEFVSCCLDPHRAVGMHGWEKYTVVRVCVLLPSVVSSHFAKWKIALCVFFCLCLFADESTSANRGENGSGDSCLVRSFDWLWCSADAG